MARLAAAVADDVEGPGGDDETPEPSIRETIEAARDEVIDRQAGERDAPEGGGEQSGPVRDNSGRFTRRAASGDGVGGESAPRPASAAAAPVAQPQPAGAGAAGVDPAAGGAPAPAAANAELAPQAWSPALKAEWPKLPATVRAEIARRETEMHTALTRQDEQRTYGRQFSEISQANSDVIMRAGVHPLRLYQDFLGIMKVLGGNDANSKAALLRDVALRNGLDMRSLLGMPQQGPGGPQNPRPPQQPANGGQPAVVIPPHIEQMAQQWAQFQADNQRKAQEQEYQQQQETYQEIVDFRAQPDVPYFDAVKDQMVALLQAGAASTLKDAYDQATWARPDIRALRQQAEQKTAQEAEAKRLRAQNARLKGGSVRGGSGSVPQGGGDASTRSLREELQHNFADARARV